MSRVFKPVQIPNQKALNEVQAQVKEAEAGGQKDNFNNPFDTVVTPQTVSMNLLKEGFVQSYIDFYYLVSDTLPVIIEPSAKYLEELENNKRAKKKISDTPDKLLELKKALTIAEENSRYPDKGQAIINYSQLAEKFLEEEQFQAAAYFYKKCMRLAKESSNHTWESKATMGLGRCYYRLDRLDKAIQSNEFALLKAKENDLFGLAREVSRSLVDIYKQMANSFLKSKDKDAETSALIYLDKCLDAAVTAADSKGEGEICHKIGNLYLERGDYEKALKYQLRDLELAKKADEKTKTSEIEANASLAKTYMKLGKISEAQHYLEQYWLLSKDNKRLNYQADAARQLAKMYQQQGDVKKSLEYYQHYFECARSEKDNKNRKLIDKARVIVGIAKADLNMDEHIKKTSNTFTNIKPLLEWKSKTGEKK
eukprot:CAMPEP_0176443648 /NCGR_PEP_ID=MMETSP0127-20121128/22562_1 /TAXON_ID=938130 /ORGANISM="Platyophrya macrostoma, Strain WH" /LENGTH=424 /DNA_ID=CAMNT_0017828945 /DNA_START=23 /DNA_END=1297 /DNA_ORIENTATION=-